MGKNATLKQIAELVSMIAAGDYDRDFVQAMIGKRVIIRPDATPYRGGPSSEKQDLITVPRLSAAELVARAKEKLNLTYLNPDLARRGFVTDEAGKTYEVLVWAPGRYVTTDEVRKHFEALKADGNTAAFVAWITENDPEGWHASIPSDDSRLFPFGGHLYAPRFYRDDDDRDLRLSHVDGEWDGGCRFVAFREVK